MGTGTDEWIVGGLVFSFWGDVKRVWIAQCI